jgi:hypothetical protein
LEFTISLLFIPSIPDSSSFKEPPPEIFTKKLCHHTGPEMKPDAKFSPPERNTGRPQNFLQPIIIEARKYPLSQGFRVSPGSIQSGQTTPSQS